jgi:hypothetical protein
MPLGICRVVITKTGNAMIELNKIDEIAHRLRQYELDDKPRYFNIKYLNKAYTRPQLIAERMSGEHEFRRRIHEAINTFKAEKIIVEEFNQKAKSVKEPTNVIEINIENSPQYTIISPPSDKEKETGTKEETNQNNTPQSQPSNPLEAFGGLEGFRQEVRNEIAKEYQLIKEQEEKKKLLEENERLKNENQDLNEDNTKLYELNSELSDKIQDLQKYIPENLKIGNLSVTKILGSILGTATETMVKNVVMKRPDKVKDIIGEVAFEQLSGLVNDDDDAEMDLALDNSQLQAVQPISGTQNRQTGENPVVSAINQINTGLPPEQLAKVQIIYYHLLNDDESLDDEKLNEMVKFINDNKETDEGKEE